MPCVSQDTNIEYFDAGSSFGIKDILTVRNDRRVINFYPSARLDGLVSREEVQVRVLTDIPWLKVKWYQ